MIAKSVTYIASAVREGLRDEPGIPRWPVLGAGSSLGDRPAQRVKVGGAWRDVSWRALGEEVREVALGLIALGRQPGDAVGLLSQSRAEWVRADFAIFSTGGVTIPVYPSYPPETLAYIVRDSEARTLFVEDEHAAREGAGARAAEMPSLETVVLMQGRAPDPGRRGARPRARLGGAAGARAATGASAAATRDRAWPAIKPGDVATIVYTSGTTAPRRASCRRTATTSPRST